MRISDWSSDVCSSDLFVGQADGDHGLAPTAVALGVRAEARQVDHGVIGRKATQFLDLGPNQHRADEQTVPRQFGNHANPDAVLGLRTAVKILDEQLPPTGKGTAETKSELPSLMRISYAVFCLKKKNNTSKNQY